MKSFPKFRCSNPGVSRPKTIRMLLTKVVEKMVTKLVRRPVSTSLSWNVRNDPTADLVRGTLITIMSVDTKDMLLNWNNWKTLKFIDLEIVFENHKSLKVWGLDKRIEVITFNFRFTSVYYFIKTMRFNFTSEISTLHISSTDSVMRIKSNHWFQISDLRNTLDPRSQDPVLSSKSLSTQFRYRYLPQYLLVRMGHFNGPQWITSS